MLTPFRKCGRCENKRVCFKPKGSKRQACQRCSKDKKPCTYPGQTPKRKPRRAVVDSGEKPRGDFETSDGCTLLEAIQAQSARFEEVMDEVRERLANIEAGQAALAERLDTIDNRLRVVPEGSGWLG